MFGIFIHLLPKKKTQLCARTVFVFFSEQPLLHHKNVSINNNIFSIMHTCNCSITNLQCFQLNGHFHFFTIVQQRNSI